MSVVEQKPKNKRDIVHTLDLIQYGLTIDDIKYENTFRQSRFFLCCVRALLLFLGTCGCVGSTISAFSLPYNLPAYIGAVLLLSFLVAFIYYNRITFYFGYILFFFIFTITITSLYWYVNSGYQAFMNVFYQQYSIHFNLNSAREATEYISNRYLTVTIAMIFVSAFICILLNIAISGRMSIIETFLITFPLVQVGLYINKKPSIIYLAMLLATYITVAVLGRSNHYKIPDFKKSKQDFITEYNKNNSIVQTYASDGGSQLLITGISVMFSVLFLLITSSIFYTNLDLDGYKSKLKNTTDEYVKLIVENGIYGLFNRYTATGGLASGKLGGVGSVNPDYQPDLTIEFVPTSLTPVYLKAYEGIVYHDNAFVDRTSSYYGAYYYHPVTTEELSSSYAALYSLSKHSPVNSVKAKMTVENVGANNMCAYMPYFTTNAPYEVDNTNWHQNKYTVEYNPFQLQSRYIVQDIPDDSLENEAYEFYLEVPENLCETLDNFIAELDIDDLLENYKSATTYEEKYAIRLDILTAINSKFLTDYPYTMAPGVTPYGKDFVEYFLNQQKRGYCAHYAASSTLILRRLGIPTKYVEGYMISASDYEEGTLVSEDTTGWINDDYDNTILDPVVISVDITDGSAHAWTEVYMDGYGWMPYDFTPPSTEDSMITNLSLGNILGGLLLSSANSENSNNKQVKDQDSDTEKQFFNFSFNFNTTFGFIIFPLIYVLLVALLVFTITSNINTIKLYIKLKKGLKQMDYKACINITLILFYQKAKKIIKIEPDTNLTVNELAAKITDYLNQHIKDKSKLPLLEKEIQTMTDIANQSLYSKTTYDKNDYILLTNKCSYITKELRSAP